MLQRTSFSLISLVVFCTASCNQQDVNGDPPFQSAESLDVGEAGEKFRVRFETSKGEFVIEVTPSWAPRGAAQFRELVESGFYDDCRVFRVIPGFMAQFGINGDPAIQAKWRDRQIADDPVTQSNKRGYVTFAKTDQPNSRTTQIFINYVDNLGLDAQGFAPFGRVIEGLDVVESLHSGYGGAPSNEQPTIQSRGNEFLNKQFPKLDYVTRTTLLDDPNNG